MYNSFLNKKKKQYLKIYSKCQGTKDFESYLNKTQAIKHFGRVKLLSQLQFSYFKNDTSCIY